MASNASGGAGGRKSNWEVMQTPTGWTRDPNPDPVTGDRALQDGRGAGLADGDDLALGGGQDRFVQGGEFICWQLLRDSWRQRLRRRRVRDRVHHAGSLRQLVEPDLPLLQSFQVGESTLCTRTCNLINALLNYANTYIDNR